MPFEARLGFTNENNRRDFAEKLLPKLPGCRVVTEDTPAPDAEDTGAYTDWLRLTISSPTAARDLCHQLMAFLSHHKQSGVLLQWQGGDGTPQSAQLSGQSQRDAEVVAMRLSTAVKALNDAERAANKNPPITPINTD
ncbi:MAG TPA: hypothetical protein VFB38_27285 [Chthonomonadaceae bacterium]|nr:hypothetical protein [Chthonomonadaceae bacterium]